MGNRTRTLPTLRGVIAGNGRFLPVPTGRRPPPGLPWPPPPPPRQPAGSIARESMGRGRWSQSPPPRLPPRKFRPLETLRSSPEKFWGSGNFARRFSSGSFCPASDRFRFPAPSFQPAEINTVRHHRFVSLRSGAHACVALRKVAFCRSAGFRYCVRASEACEREDRGSWLALGLSIDRMIRTFGLLIRARRRSCRFHSCQAGGLVD